MLSYAQDYNCPMYSSSDCSTVKKSQKCDKYFQFSWNYTNDQPLVWPVHCVNNPNSNKYCMATAIFPSTPTSGLCRPRCVNNLKRYFWTANGCDNLTSLSDCVLSVSNCGNTNVIGARMMKTLTLVIRHSCVTMVLFKFSFDRMKIAFLLC